MKRWWKTVAIAILACLMSVFLLAGCSSLGDLFGGNHNNNNNEEPEDPNDPSYPGENGNVISGVSARALAAKQFERATVSMDLEYDGDIEGDAKVDYGTGNYDAVLEINHGTSDSEEYSLFYRGGKGFGTLGTAVTSLGYLGEMPKSEANAELAALGNALALSFIDNAVILYEESDYDGLWRTEAELYPMESELLYSLNNMQDDERSVAEAAKDVRLFNAATAPFTAAQFNRLLTLLGGTNAVCAEDCGKLAAVQPAQSETAYSYLLRAIAQVYGGGSDGFGKLLSERMMAISNSVPEHYMGVGVENGIRVLFADLMGVIAKATMGISPMAMYGNPLAEVAFTWGSYFKYNFENSGELKSISYLVESLVMEDGYGYEMPFEGEVTFEADPIKSIDSVPVVYTQEVLPDGSVTYTSGTDSITVVWKDGWPDSVTSYVANGITYPCTSEKDGTNLIVHIGDFDPYRLRCNVNYGAISIELSSVETWSRLAIFIDTYDIIRYSGSVKDFAEKELSAVTQTAMPPIAHARLQDLYGSAANYTLYYKVGTADEVSVSYRGIQTVGSTDLYYAEYYEGGAHNYIRVSEEGAELYRQSQYLTQKANGDERYVKLSADVLYAESPFYLLATLTEAQYAAGSYADGVLTLTVDGTEYAFRVGADGYNCFFDQVTYEQNGTKIVVRYGNGYSWFELPQESEIVEPLQPLDTLALRGAVNSSKSARYVTIKRRYGSDVTLDTQEKIVCSGEVNSTYATYYYKRGDTLYETRHSSSGAWEESENPYNMEWYEAQLNSPLQKIPADLDYAALAFDEAEGLYSFTESGVRYAFRIENGKIVTLYVDEEEIDFSGYGESFTVPKPKLSASAFETALQNSVNATSYTAKLVSTELGITVVEKFDFDNDLKSETYTNADNEKMLNLYRVSEGGKIYLYSDNSGVWLRAETVADEDGTFIKSTSELSGIAKRLESFNYNEWKYDEAKGTYSYNYGAIVLTVTDGYISSIVNTKWSDGESTSVSITFSDYNKTSLEAPAPGTKQLAEGEPTRKQFHDIVTKAKNAQNYTMECSINAPMALESMPGMEGAGQSIEGVECTFNLVHKIDVIRSGNETADDNGKCPSLTIQSLEELRVGFTMVFNEEALAEFRKNNGNVPIGEDGVYNVQMESRKTYYDYTGSNETLKTYTSTNSDAEHPFAGAQAVTTTGVKKEDLWSNPCFYHFMMGSTQEFDVDVLYVLARYNEKEKTFDLVNFDLTSMQRTELGIGLDMEKEEVRTIVVRNSDQFKSLAENPEFPISIDLSTVTYTYTYNETTIDKTALGITG